MHPYGEFPIFGVAEGSPWHRSCGVTEVLPSPSKPPIRVRPDLQWSIMADGDDGDDGDDDDDDI